MNSSIPGLVTKISSPFSSSNSNWKIPSSLICNSNLFSQLLLSECKSQLSIIGGHLSCNSPHWHLGQQISDEYTDGKPANGALNGLGQLKIQLRLSECSVIIITDIMELGIVLVLVCKQKGHE